MSGEIVLGDEQDLADLGVFFSRAKRLDPDGAVRLQGHGATLSVTVAPLHSGGLTGTTVPTVLGIRILEATAATSLDAVVPLAAMSDRIARASSAGQLALPLPPQAVSASWAGVSPPKGGWERIAPVSAGKLRDAAEAGIAAIADALPERPGALVTAGVRASVWGSGLVLGLGGTVDKIPLGAAFAAEGLGFLPGRVGAVGIFASGPWARLSTPAGHVLARLLS